MNAVASILFVVAGMSAVVAIRHSVRTALPAFRTLRAQLAGDVTEGAIITSKLQTRDAPEFEPVSIGAVRHRGQRRPKPVTHRLHQFVGTLRAA